MKSSYIGRPQQLKGYLETAHTESGHIQAYKKQLEAHFADAAKLELIKYEVLVDAVDLNDHGNNIAVRHQVTTYLHAIEQHRNSVDRLKSAIHSHDHNMHVLIGWMGKYNPEVYKFKTKLHRLEKDYELAKSLQIKALRFVSLCDSQIRLIEGTLKAFTEATHRGAYYDELARFRLIQQNIELLNLLAFPTE